MQLSGYRKMKLLYNAKFNLLSVLPSIYWSACLHISNDRPPQLESRGHKSETRY